MALYFSSKYQTHKIDNVFNRSEDLADEASTIEGGACTWVIPTLGATRIITVQRYDPTRAAEYLQENGKPIVVIKCKGDASVNNATIVTSDGAIPTAGTTTLYTFAADYSATPRYLVLRVSATSGADGHPLWEVA